MTHAAARHAPGRWYFGWNIVAAGSLLTLLTVGMRMSIGPFFLPIAADLGFSRSLLAAIVAVGAFVRLARFGGGFADGEIGRRRADTSIGVGLSCIRLW